MVRWGGVDEVRLTVTCDVQVTAMTGAGCEPADPGGVSQAVT
ncbi:putative lipoprotein [Actinomyces naeslundii str. Howell 279]|uniref:Putative lipoprotein n=1 Tax=Actinomyces naeslundii (strain ATCC 12104 / DSM 43013 / CCUG 2238 / JCM 8349 / NCTC 10301 / Howell 279) TaxID=1115803 RepID=J3JIF5_ACTNH|nr:putative lipoprotein [Actinomyces naeslundii str. Howell 279]